MRIFLRNLLLGVLLGIFGSSCATSALWEASDPTERVWVSNSGHESGFWKGADGRVWVRAGEATQDEVDALEAEDFPADDVDALEAEDSSADEGGYFAEKSRLQKVENYARRIVWTPATLLVDVVCVVAVVCAEDPILVGLIADAIF